MLMLYIMVYRQIGGNVAYTDEFCKGIKADL